MYSNVLLLMVFLAPGIFAQSQGLLVSGYSHASPQVLISPGQIMSLFFRSVEVPEAVASGYPLPTRLAGVTVILDGRPIPIFSIRRALGGGGPGVSLERLSDVMIVNVQIPTHLCHSPTDNRCLPYWVLPLAVRFNDMEVAAMEVSLFRPAKVHILRGEDSIVNDMRNPGPRITRSDGSLAGLSNPPLPGEEITIYATAIGMTFPRVETGMPATGPSATGLQSRARVGLTVLSGNSSARRSTIKPSYVGLTPGSAGLYQINVKIPEDLDFPVRIGGCGPDVYVVALQYYYEDAEIPGDEASICVKRKREE